MNDHYLQRNLEVGQNSLEVCQTIIAHHSKIELVRLISHETAINWRQRYSEAKEKMSYLAECLEHAVPLRERWYRREEFSNLNISDLNAADSKQVWSVNSRIQCYGTEGFSLAYYMHLPMMNFHLEKGVTKDDMLKAIEYICPSKKGVLLESGRYYYYYGDFLLTEKEWYKFLAEFLMSCILVSPRYIGHALNDGYCSLRLTAEPVYKPKIPEVIKVFG